MVDDQMRAVDDNHVFAVGECVQHRGEVYGLVAPLWEQAVVLADVITGTIRGDLPRFPHRYEAQGRWCRGSFDGADRAGAGRRRAHHLL